MFYLFKSNDLEWGSCRSLGFWLAVPPLSHKYLIHIWMKVSVTLKWANEYFSPVDSNDSCRYKAWNSASSTLHREIFKSLSNAWTHFSFGCQHTCDNVNAVRKIPLTPHSWIKFSQTTHQALLTFYIFSSWILSIWNYWIFLYSFK